MDIALPLTDFLLACRYAYYVLHQSIMPDGEYDMLEAQWFAVNPCPIEELFNAPHALRSPGSDRKEDYAPHIRALAIYYLTRHGVTAGDEFDFGL